MNKIEDMPFSIEFTEEGKALMARTYKEHREEIKEWYIWRIEDLMQNGKSGSEISHLFLGLIACYTDALFYE